MRKNQNRNEQLDEYYDNLSSGTQESNSFADSLDGMRESDFAKVRRAPYAKRTKRRKNLLSAAISFAFILFCASVFVYCSYQIVLILMQYGEADDLYDEYAKQRRDALDGGEAVQVAALKADNESDPMKSYDEVASGGVILYDPSKYISQQTSSVKFQQTLVYLSSLKQTNPDTYGYIEIAGTRVDYPLVQSDDNDYYLYHSFTGDALKAGAIFVDFRNSRTLLYNRNTVIYGHNMESGAMFHSLINYKDESFFRSKQIVISTFDGIYTFEVFSFYETKADIDYFRTWFQNDDDFVNFCTEEEKNSMYHKDGITFDGNSVIITLSTCITGVTDGRYCLHAILVDIEK